MSGWSASPFRSLNALGLIAISAVLAYALVAQFLAHELPCPLCLLQRLGFCAVASGLLMNVVLGCRIAHYSFSLIAAVGGGATALRLVSLHVIPGSPRYGDAVLGLHFYPWAFLLFVLIVVGLAVMVCISRQYQEEGGFVAWSAHSWLCRSAVVSIMLLIAVNAISTFAMCGPGVCPDDPVSYWLLD